MHKAYCNVYYVYVHHVLPLHVTFKRKYFRHYRNLISTVYSIIKLGLYVFPTNEFPDNA